MLRIAPEKPRRYWAIIEPCAYIRKWWFLNHAIGSCQTVLSMLSELSVIGVCSLPQNDTSKFYQSFLLKRSHNEDIQIILRRRLSAIQGDFQDVKSIALNLFRPSISPTDSMGREIVKAPNTEILKASNSLQPHLQFTLFLPSSWGHIQICHDSCAQLLGSCLQQQQDLLREGVHSSHFPESRPLCKPEDTQRQAA